LFLIVFDLIDATGFAKDFSQLKEAEDCRHPLRITKRQSTYSRYLFGHTSFMITRKFAKAAKVQREARFWQ
jgi:hypothetical protein